MSRTYGQKVQARKQSRDMSLVGSADWPLCHKFWNALANVLETCPCFFEIFFSMFFVFPPSFLVFLPSPLCSRSWYVRSEACNHGSRSGPSEKHVRGERRGCSRPPSCLWQSLRPDVNSTSLTSTARLSSYETYVHPVRRSQRRTCGHPVSLFSV